MNVSSDECQVEEGETLKVSSNEGQVDELIVQYMIITEQGVRQQQLLMTTK